MKVMDGNEDEINDKEGIYEDYDTRGEIILQCYNALASVEMLDPYDKEGQKQKKRIQKNALKVIDYYISEIAAEIFDEEKEED